MHRFACADINDDTNGPKHKEYQADINFLTFPPFTRFFLVITLLVLTFALWCALMDFSLHKPLVPHLALSLLFPCTFTISIHSFKITPESKRIIISKTEGLSGSVFVLLFFFLDVIKCVNYLNPYLNIIYSLKEKSLTTYFV